MSHQQTIQDGSTMTYKRPVANGERLFSLSPFSVVVVVARVKGSVSEAMLRAAIDAARIKHPLLSTRIIKDEAGDPWFTTEGSGDIEVQAISRSSDDQWIDVLVQARKAPFDFGERPPIRFLLLQSKDRAEMIIMCHHIICDGLSLAYLARDLMTHLGEPGGSVAETLEPVPVDASTLPEEAKLNGLARFFVKRINTKWHEEKVQFDQQDYVGLSDAYWQHFNHRCLSVELSEQETGKFVERCRRHGVTVNSALAAAFAGAQAIVLGPTAYNSRLAVAVNLRRRLARDVGEAMGFYAGAPVLECRYKASQAFWRNALRFHKAIRSRLDDKHVLQDFVNWSHLDPTILEAINYKKLGHLMDREHPSHAKLAAFAAREDVVSRILQRDGQLSLEQLTMGTAITNLTRLDFPTTFGSLRLERMMMVPGGAFPLVNCGLVLGAVTCADRLSLAIEYAEQAVSTATMEQIRDRAMVLLREER